eukprot:CAMPEP_0174980556 /NCGR_PEP_ID=MMETSP0004_2-20121128/15415_1 /TAXON_ID=420556 /ORGANISM="Ochromonas sp., Strain CCMP1393" /LENGTH=290 /DNA_ID=CAMNT_0016232233 /DNA_START=48 /DNA_END=920 /DNA_ORIENTATION=-
MSVFTDWFADWVTYLRVGHTVERKDTYEYYMIDRIDGVEFTCTEVSTSQLLDKSFIKSRGLRICVISDTHERHNSLGILPACDILIHSGDIVMRGRTYPHGNNIRKLEDFNNWLGLQPAKHRIVVAGNHDNVIESLSIQSLTTIFSNATYLCNASIEVEGVRIFGTPTSNGHSRNAAFQSKTFRDETIKSIKNISHRVDILITHGPCRSLGKQVQPRIAHISGHAHTLHGIFPAMKDTFIDEEEDSVANIDMDGEKVGQSWLQVSAPIMDKHYNPTQLPIVFDVVDKAHA